MICVLFVQRLGRKAHRIVASDETRRLIAALDGEYRPLWATAMYAGVRCGEMRALRVENLDLQLKRIVIRHGWDQYAGEIDPKSEKGKRTTVIIKLLHELLVGHLERTPAARRRGRGSRPSTPTTTGSATRRLVFFAAVP
jgi:integrase